ncbi:LysR family transcriptional regulator [Marisediminitalea sp.]|uniref:LysR family transcriptional regulator n=1 Tax=Marisediminitalea sp. TaxID=2662268 RepID=UPI003517617D
MQYTLSDLRLFLAIAETGNLTKGAEKVCLAPSTASHKIKTLESNIGTLLLSRHARGISLTTAGEIFLRHARHTLANLEQMHADLMPFAKGLQGHIRLWANTHAIHSYLPADLAVFLGEHPTVSIALEEHTSADILDAVQKGDIDAGIVAEPNDSRPLTLLDYRDDRLVLITPHAHPLAKNQRVAFANVLHHPFVMLHNGSAIHTFTMNIASQLGQHLNVRVQVKSFEAVCRMVSAGVGIGLVPFDAVAQQPHLPVSVIDLDEAWAQRSLKVCVRSQTTLSTFTQLLVDQLTTKNNRT